MLNVIVWATVVVLLAAFVGFRDWKRQKKLAKEDAQIEQDLSFAEQKLQRVTEIRRKASTIPPAPPVQKSAASG
jgi:hypothetical protein